MIHLLDSNVLTALGWEMHEHHCRVWKWFQRANGFATCPITQLAFLHISMSLPDYAPDAQAVRAVLERITRHPSHTFIPCDKSVDFAPKNSDPGGSATQAYLIALARSHGAKLATLEKSPLRKGVFLIPR